MEQMLKSLGNTCFYYFIPFRPLLSWTFIWFSWKAAIDEEGLGLSSRSSFHPLLLQAVIVSLGSLLNGSGNLRIDEAG